MLDRRTLLKATLLGGAALAVPPSVGPWPIWPAETCRSPPRPAPRSNRSRARCGSPPLVLEPVRTDATTDYYRVRMQRAQQEIIPGKPTTIWGYEGQLPGPTIKARRGRRVVIQQVNDLKVPTTVHLHGGHVAPRHDGYPTDLIKPGDTRKYVYPNSQQAATLWVSFTTAWTARACRSTWAWPART